MALSDTSNVSTCEKPVAESHKHEKKEKFPTKVIIRRLPPGMSQDSFLTQVSPVPDYDYIYTVKGDMSLGENSFSRVYINFVNSEDVYMFKEKFDNYVFVDTKGHEYSAVVEFSAFQKIPKKRGKPRCDPKIGSIESDPIYKDFLESLKEQPNQDEKPEFSYQPSSDNKNDISTPLLDYLKQRKIDKLKSREEKREERRKKEIERRKVRDEERKKRYEEKSPIKSHTKSNYSQTKLESNVTDKTDRKDIKEDEEKSPEKNEEKSEDQKKLSPNTYKGKDKKFDDYRSSTKPKPRFPIRSDKYESYDKRDYKSRRDEYKDRDRRGRFDDYRKDDYRKDDYRKDDYRKDDYRKDDYKKETDVKQYPKKVKKYSERREERKIEAKKAEQKKEQVSSKNDNPEDLIDKAKEIETELEPESGNTLLKSASSSFERSNSEDGRSSKEDYIKMIEKENKEEVKSDDQDRDRFKNKENDPRVQRRIRNKDRPTMAIYQPGMLSKRRHVDDDKDSKEPTSGKE